MKMKTNFDKKLRAALDAAGMSRAELARRLGVGVPEVSRWLAGVSAPDVYQFQRIAQVLGLSYEWLLDDGPGAAEIAERLGLCEDTVAFLMELAEMEGEGVLDAVDNAVYAAAATVQAVYDDMTERVEAGVDRLMREEPRDA